MIKPGEFQNERTENEGVELWRGKILFDSQQTAIIDIYLRDNLFSYSSCICR